MHEKELRDDIREVKIKFNKKAIKKDNTFTHAMTKKIAARIFILQPQKGGYEKKILPKYNQ